MYIILNVKINKKKNEKNISKRKLKKFFLIMIFNNIKNERKIIISPDK